MPVNCIEYHTGTNDGLYIGTDVGLFYKDASMSEWKCLNSGQPALLVTDIEVDYCINKLIVSTFGRGVYRTSLVEEETFTSILTDRLIDIPTVSQGGMVIEPGVTLTVTSDLYMGENARIIVKPNARLIIDGGTISNKCGKMWSGIEVWGTSSMPQASSSFSLDPNQGKLVIKNSGVIEHANCAVRLGHLASTNPWQYDWSKTGGVINVRNGILRNNRKSIEYLSYHNYNNLGNMSANRGYFYDCSFEIDNDYRYPNQQHTAFVTMWDVDNIKFKGCNFNNSSSAVVWADRGLGIYSAMSTFTIDDYCTAGILEYGTPCPIENTLRSEFHGLQYAIKASGATNYSKVRVNHSIVQDCYNGIYLALVNNAVIIRNNFDRIENSGSPTYSLYLDECSGYEVEENVFEGLDHDGCRGLIVNNSGDAPNLVYRNLFKNHTYGILVIGDNRGLQHEGLQFRCNLFGDPGDATQSNEFALGLVDNASIADYQGNLSEYTSAANRFWPECVFYDPDDEDEIILSDPDQISIFDYIHNSGVNSPETVPECRSIGIGLIDNAVPFSIQQCPLDLEDGKDKIVVKSQMQESHDVYVSLKSAYDSYINNGEGPSLSDAVSDLSVSSVELRNVFLDASPKVSDDLMIRAMQRTPEVDGWHMAQILIANSPLREVVINAMNRYDYEPFYTALVEGAQNGTVNTRNLMEMDYAWYRSLQEQYCDDFIRLNLQEEETDWGSIQQLFNDPSAPLTIGEEASFYIEKGDWTSAHAILDSWPEPTDDEFLLYQTILRIKEFGLDATGLQEQTVTELETLVFSSEPQVKSCASFILEFWDEGTFSEELGTIGGVRGLTQIYDGETSSDIFQFEPSPNPAKESFFLTFKVPETSESGVIHIFDVSGKRVYQSKIVGTTGIIEINCSKWRTGTYIAELEVDGILLKTTKVSIIK